MNIQFGGIGGLIVLVLDVWAIVNVLQSPGDVPKKVGWTVLIIILPVLGFILWALFGPRARKG
jgi:hypothetical protein